MLLFGSVSRSSQDLTVALCCSDSYSSWWLKKPSDISWDWWEGSGGKSLAMQAWASEFRSPAPMWKSFMVAGVSNHSVGDVETEACWTTSLVKMVNSRWENLCLQRRWSAIEEDPWYLLQTSTHAHTDEYLCTHTQATTTTSQYHSRAGLQISLLHIVLFPGHQR